MDACIDGDLGKLESELDRNMTIFINSGVYLVLEKLRHLTIRNLLKKIAMSIQKNPQDL